MVDIPPIKVQQIPLLLLWLPGKKTHAMDFRAKLQVRGLPANYIKWQHDADMDNSYKITLQQHRKVHHARQMHYASLIWRKWKSIARSRSQLRELTWKQTAHTLMQFKYNLTPEGKRNDMKREKLDIKSNWSFTKILTWVLSFCFLAWCVWVKFFFIIVCVCVCLFWGGGMYCLSIKGKAGCR